MKSCNCSGIRKKPRVRPGISYVFSLHSYCARSEPAVSESCSLKSFVRIYENTVRTLGFFLISKRFRIYSVDSQIIYAYLWKSAASVHYFHRYYLLNHKIGYVERNCSHLNRIFTFSSENNSSEQLCDFILKSTLSSPDGTFS